MPRCVQQIAPCKLALSDHKTVFGESVIGKGEGDGWNRDLKQDNPKDVSPM